MLQLTKLRNERRFNREIGEIVNVLKGIASSEFYRLQKERRRLDELGDYLEKFFQMIDVSESRQPFLEVSRSSQAIVVITSDSGFSGKLNSSVVNSALEQRAGDDKFIVVGTQGIRLIEESALVKEGSSNRRGKSPALLYGGNLPGVISFAGISGGVEYKEAERLGNFISGSFLDKNIGRTIIVYPHFVSFSVWQVQIYQLFPCRFLFKESSGSRGEEEKIIFEPSLSKTIEYIVRLWVNHILYGIFWESKLSEWSARVMHLEGSSYEIKQLDKELRFRYFRVLHEISDRDIREIFSSRLAMRRSE